MIRIATTRVLLLENSQRKYEIKPGSYFLEFKTINKISYLVLEGREIGLPIKDWRKLKNKGVKPKSFLARIIF